MYIYDNIYQLSYKEIITRHQKDTLIGCLKLYPDNTECYIEEYAWEEIIEHIEKGGGVGYDP